MVVEAADTEEEYETVTETDPDTNQRVKKRRLKGHTRKVKLAKRLEALKLLAMKHGLIGPDAEANKPPPAPLVIGGDANVDAL